MFSLNNKINELTQQNRNRDIDTENKYIMAKGKRGREEERNRRGKEIKTYKLPVAK